MLNKFFRNRNLIWIGVAFGAFLYFVESLFHVVILHGGSLTQELIAPDGYELWLRGIIWLICILAGVLLQWASVRLRRATQALRESEERLRSTILSMDDLLFVLDRDGNFLDYHAPQSSMLYVPPERFLGKHYREVMPPPIAERIDKALTRALNNERSQTEYELELNGQTFWFDARLAPRHDSAGRVDSVTVVVKDITIQKQAELVLQTSEKSYRGLFNSVADAIYIQDKDGRFLDVNDGAVKMYGYPREFFIGKTPESLSAPGKNNMEEVVQKVVRAFTTGEPQRFDFWGLRSNGEVFPKDVRVYKGNYFGQEALIVLATDITERKRTEEALRNSEATLRATLESTGDGILVVDGSGRVIQTNDRFSELWRIPQPVLDAWDDQKLLDHILDQLIDPESFLDKVKQLYASSKDDYDVLFFKDNRVYERFSSPLILNDEVAGRVWSFNDITDRVRVEEELQRNKLMIDTANASILWIRRDGTLTDVNGSVCRMLGYSREELLSMSVFDFDQRFDNERWAASWQETKSTAKSHSFSEHTRKDGQIIPVEIISNYLEYNGEEYQCCFVTDISRRKRNETVQSVLYEISEATGRASSLVELLEVIQKEIGRLIDTNNFYVALYDEVSGLYSFPFARDDMSGDPTLIPPQNLKRSLTDYVRRRGEAVLLSQSEIEALARNGEIDLIGELARIWMGIPLLLSGRVIGVVGIQSYTNEAQYSEQDRDLMSIVASSIAMAIERKQSEEDLAAANQMMRNVLDTIPVRVFWKDVNSVYLGCNELYAFDAGCDDSSEVIGKTDADLKWKSEAESFQATDRDIMATGIPRLDYLEPLYYPDGSRGWSQTSKIPLRNTNDQIVGVLGVYQDITDRIRAEEAVRHERDIAQRYLNIAGVLLLALDTKGIVTMINPKGCGILGYEQNELIGSNWFDKCVPFDIRESTRAEFCTLLTGVKGNVGSFENPVLTASGERRLIAWNDTLVRDDDGIVIGTLSSGEDITDRKRSEAILLQKEANLAEAQRIAKVGSWEYNLETDEIEASDELHRIYGLDPAHKVNRCGVFSLMTHPDDKDRVFASNEACNKNGKSIDMRYRIVRTDGEVRHVHEQAHVRLDQNGRPLHVFGTVQDITEQVNAEEERKSLESQLRRTQRLETIGTLAGGIAHDFNNILTPILGYADMAMISVPEDHDVRQDLEHVIKAAHRAKELVKQILAFSRQGDQEKKPLEIHLIVKEVLELLRATLPSTIEIRQNIQMDCGSVLADPSQIHQVMMNLCTNAFHAMRSNGGTLSVNLTLDTGFARIRPGLTDHPYVKLTISDTGYGMNKETLDRIFEPFFTTKGVGEGTGLGLSVVHGIVTNHGGEIAVDSTPGKGTTFSIYLPQVQHHTSAHTCTSSNAGGGDEHILLVDDEEEITIMTKRILEKYGYRVTTRNSSVDALKLFSASPREFDLVICDQTMPYLTGSELSSELLAIRPDIPIIMMTGYSESITAKDARRLGIRDYLNKPLIASELTSAIRKQLGHSKTSEV